VPESAALAEVFEMDPPAHLFPIAVGSAAIRIGDDLLPLYAAEANAVRFSVDRRRREFAGGRHCARLAMAALGRPASAIPQGPDRAPVWPHGLVGSITHSGDICAAVVANSNVFESIGIDMQPVASIAADLAGYVLRPDEAAPLQDDRPDQVDWPTLHYCLKEAAYKTFYPMRRRMIGFHDVRLRIDREARTFIAETTGSLEAPLAFGGRYTLQDGQILGACWYE
jgi:enterobactin synthetase component D